MVITERLQAVFAARAVVANDMFGGWTDQDVELFSRWAVDQSDVTVEPGLIIDWLGCRTEMRNYARIAVPQEGGLVVGDLPIPGDSVHADAIEYVGLLTGIERALASGRSTFTMLELGASYAPWAVHAGLAARRAGFERIVLKAVEASGSAMERIDAHARLNGLLDDPAVEFSSRHAAVGAERGVLYFPIVDTSLDNGAQTAARPRKVDYRGHVIEHEKVNAVTIGDLSEGLDTVDFVHLDVQGAERSLLQSRKTLDCLRKKVSTMLLATHSRLIEGIAIEALTKSGWQLLRERPVGFVQNAVTDDPVGWTMHDGAQLWANPRFG